MKKFSVKLIKGVVAVLVLCFAAYGLYAVLKKPPRLDISTEEAKELAQSGIFVPSGDASDNGLSPVFGGEGVPPIGSPITSNTMLNGAANGGAALNTPVSSSTAPPLFGSAPVLESAPAMPPTFPDPFPESLPPVPPAVGNPLGPAPNFGAGIPPEGQPERAVLPQTELKILHLTDPAPPPPEPEPVILAVSPITDPSSPLPEEWDGPASAVPANAGGEIRTIPFAPISTLPLDPFSPQTHNSPENAPLVQTDAFDGIAYRPLVNPIAEIASKVRQLPYTDPIDRNHLDPPNLAPPANEAGEIRQTTDNYVKTSNRLNLVFEPEKPEMDGKNPVVMFAPPKISTGGGDARLPENPVTPLIRSAVARFVDEQRQIAESGNVNRIRSAFIELSLLYEQKALNDAERAKMQPVLDTLASSVIYARDTHVLEQPYHVQQGETIESVAGKFKLTPAILCRINGLMPGQQLRSGTALKVLAGQFDAKISLRRKELTLSLGGLYAGRFPVQINQMSANGDFYVTQISRQGITLSNGWIISAGPVNNTAVILAEKDAKEILDILSLHSVVVLEN